MRAGHSELMRIRLKKYWQKLLKLLKLSPLSLAEKCRIAFGAAVVFVLTIALFLPYIWMGQITKKCFLDSERAKSEIVFDKYFRAQKTGQIKLPPLDKACVVLDANDPEIRWLRFMKGWQQLDNLTVQQKKMLESLKDEKTSNDNIRFAKKDGVLQSNYIRIIRATDKFIKNYEPQNPAVTFARNEPIGAVLIQSRVLGSELKKMTLMNRICVFIAGLIAGAGAIVAFYVITQRVILSPIRQLRALANNVAEGNLDIRSSIKTRDEYEKLANAFNHMLDGLQAAQQKLRDANKQLDAKIAELSERNIELFKANKIKSEFLANISHEFRTPLNAILGFAEILREKPDTLKKDKGRRYAENIITSGKRLLNMINDLLDLAKTEAGKMQLHVENVSVSELCDGLISTFSALTKKNKIKVKLNIDNDVPDLSTDAGKVQQILYNFLSNAVKFTPKRGRIEIRVNMLDEKHVRLAVTDTGCGIAQPDQEKIFEKFRQADDSITRESAGSGLGLAISRELAAMLAGTIGMESELEKGSTFWLDIPITLTKEQNQQQIASKK